MALFVFRGLELSACLAGPWLAATWLLGWPVVWPGGQGWLPTGQPKLPGGQASWTAAQLLANWQDGPQTSWLLAGCLAWLASAIWDFFFNLFVSGVVILFMPFSSSINRTLPYIYTYIYI